MKIRYRRVYAVTSDRTVPGTFRLMVLGR